MNDPSELETLAAVDLGSNSFHMIVARLHQGRLEVLDRLREAVRLGGGLDERGRLTEEAQERAIACLERFGQRVRDLSDHSVLAVGTNTLRKARKTGDFLERAQEALGHPIEVISGVEEARLVYLGAAHSLAMESEGRRLVVDIGGGSTELIVGEAFRAQQLESLYMGCVSMSRAFFAGGVFSKDAFRRADLAARLELRPVAANYRNMGWDVAVGTSGTIRAIREIVQQEGWSKHGISASSLRKLRKVMIDAGSLEALKLKGLSEDRAPVFAGGVAVLSAVFEALEIERMRVAQGALREGLLFDLVGRIQHEDVREASVNAMAQRHHVDQKHAARVEATALSLLDRVRDHWKLKLDDADQWVHWACRLHEVGRVVAHSQYHKHGAYLVANSDLAGFSIRDQRILAALVRTHRRKLQLPMDGIPGRLKTTLFRLSVLIRLAVLLHRGRSRRVLPELALQVQDSGLRVGFPEEWLDEHPLTRADLEREQAYLQEAEFTLVVE